MRRESPVGFESQTRSWPRRPDDRLHRSRRPMPEDEVKAWKTRRRRPGAPWASWQAGNIVALVFVIPFALFLIVGVCWVRRRRSSTCAADSGNIGPGVRPADHHAAGHRPHRLRDRQGHRLVRHAAGSSGRAWTGSRSANGMTFSPLDAEPRLPGCDLPARRLAPGGRSPRSASTAASSTSATTGTRPGRARTAARAPGASWRSTSTASCRTWCSTRRPTTASSAPTCRRRSTRTQVLSLEGDFDRYFTLYCPKEYERDALYVFTPDLMALLDRRGGAVRRRDRRRLDVRLLHRSRSGPATPACTRGCSASSTRSARRR